LLCENYGQEVGTNTLLVPNLKVGVPVSPVPTVGEMCIECYAFKTEVIYLFIHSLIHIELNIYNAETNKTTAWNAWLTQRNTTYV